MEIFRKLSFLFFSIGNTPRYDKCFNGVHIFRMNQRNRMIQRRLLHLHNNFNPSATTTADAATTAPTTAMLTRILLLPVASQDSPTSLKMSMLRRIKRKTRHWKLKNVIQKKIHLRTKM